MTDFDDVSGSCEAIAIEVQGTVMQTSDALYDLARAVCDRYWAKFQMKNRSQAHLPEDKRQLGRFAPFVRRHPANGKIYIRWLNYHPSRTGARGKKVFGVDVPPLKTGHYQPSQFGHLAQVWELDLIIKTEQQLAQIRSLQDHLHDMNVQLKKSQRKYQWQLNSSSNLPINSTAQQIQDEAEKISQLDPLLEQFLNQPGAM